LICGGDRAGRAEHVQSGLRSLAGDETTVATSQRKIEPHINSSRASLNAPHWNQSAVSGILAAGDDEVPEARVTCVPFSLQLQV
jgi:hypothetical protein